MTDFELEYTLSSHPALGPGGPPPEGRPTWAALSGGSYSIRVGDVHLLHYAADFGGHAVEHPVVRLHEDVLGMLPAVCEPVPDDVVLAFAPGSLGDAARRLRTASDALDELDESAEATLLLEASAVLAGRQLDTGYLDPSADLWLWRHADLVTIEWDNRAKLVAGQCVWSSEVGRRELAWAAFVGAVERFHERFCSDRGGRVAELAARYVAAGRPHDAAELEREHAWRKGRLAAALSRRCDAGDWRHVRQALRR
ncbi:MAG: hypothetical protein IT373_08805 [Polyangiaceae bacterium]|nr:hypothetical protein [Polyangiaceae bacterium]